MYKGTIVLHIRLEITWFSNLKINSVAPEICGVIQNV